MSKGAPGVSRGAAMTALAVERLQSSAFVGGEPGLQLQVSRAGVRAWRLFYRLPGDTRRRAIALGRYPAISLAEARKRARKYLAIAADGQDPKTARVARAKRSAFTVNLALDAYLEVCAAENSLTTVRDKKRAFANHVRPDLGSASLASLRRADWLATIDRLIGRSGMRRNLYAYLRHFLSWAVERDMIEQNPLQGVRPPKPVVARERVLSDAEIRAVWNVGGEVATIARLALLTAQRQGSLAAMRWDDLDFEQANWRIPAGSMKSGKAHDVPLSGTALDILIARPQLQGPYVFGVGSQGARPYNGFSNGVESLRRVFSSGQTVPTINDEPPWRFHDLRRTAVTLAQRAGMHLDAIRALTQHKTPGVIGVYARHAFAEEKRAVVECIERALFDALSLSR